MADSEGAVTEVGEPRRRGKAPSAALVAGAALAVCVGYFIGANIGFLLRLPPATPSIVWPPNSILTAALLLSPPGRWWIFLLAALPAHLVAELPVISPVSLVFVLYATNCLEAAIGALGVRMLSDAPTRFDTLPRVAAFVLGAGILGPFLSSFVDAAAVATLLGEPYGVVWRTRFFSNVLTELVLVPTIIFIARDAWSRVRHASPLRRVEAALLGASLAAVAMVYLSAPPKEPESLLGPLNVPVAFFIPFVLWGTVRFGPAGASLSLLATSLFVIWSATHGQGGFESPPTTASVLALQISLAVSAIPVLALAGLIEERWRDRQALADRLRFEELLARLSAAFVHLASNRMDEAFQVWLERLGQFLELDRVLLLRLSDDGRHVMASHAWARPGLAPLPTVNLSGLYPWSVRQLLREQPVMFRHPGDLPAEAGRDRTALAEMGITAKLAVPLAAGGRVLGGLSLITVGRARAWPEELVGRVQLVAEVFANALGRKESEDALRASELMKSAILASLNSSVAVLDGRGHVIEINRVWARFTPDFDQAAGREIGVGQNYLAFCREAASRGEPHAAAAVVGIEAVLDGSQTGFSLEYPVGPAATERWYAMSVVPLNRADGGAVVSNTDITERKRAELEAQRSRQDLAHVTRVSAMGELAASLAHELNQPLTGILTNAQAARRLLDAARPDLAEVRAILRDIVDDDRRAADVIQRMRDLLRKGEAEMDRLDLNTLVRGVLKLVGSDTVIRNVNVALDLDARVALVTGDRVQLEQVLLNLILNAMEAISEQIGGDRTVIVRTRSAEGSSVMVSVEDTGPGLRRGTQHMVFEPFYTTKATGMGMGLAIARSIIEAHGGKIWAEENGRGATFLFQLPRAAA
jgi:signal transduction histidine kinase/integral membrane sensor domain MASE1